MIVSSEKVSANFVLVAMVTKDAREITNIGTDFLV